MPNTNGGLTLSRKDWDADPKGSLIIAFLIEMKNYTNGDVQIIVPSSEEAGLNQAAVAAGRSIHDKFPYVWIEGIGKITFPENYNGVKSVELFREYALKSAEKTLTMASLLTKFNIYRSPLVDTAAAPPAQAAPAKK